MFPQGSNPILPLPHWCSCAKNGQAISNVVGGGWDYETSAEKRDVKFISPCVNFPTYNGSHQTCASDCAGADLRREKGQGGSANRGEGLAHVISTRVAPFAASQPQTILSSPCPLHCLICPSGYRRGVNPFMLVVAIFCIFSFWNSGLYLLLICWQ